MNLTPLFKLSLISGALMLAACGGSDNSSSDTEATARILITYSNTTDMDVLDDADEQIEILGQASAASGRVVRSDDGLSAAVVTTAGVQFVYSGLHEESEDETEEEHSETHDAEILSDLTLTDANLQVAMTQNHFAVLQNGDTLLYPAGSLEEATEAEESVALDGVTQSYPAAILDEDHGLTLVFANDMATVYEEETATGTSVDCVSPEAFVHVGELTLAQCDGGLITVVVEEEDDAEPVIEADVVDLGNLTVTALMTNGHEGFILGEGVQFKSLSWNHDTESLDIADVTLDTTATDICAVDFTTAVEVAGVLTNDGIMHYIDLEANEQQGESDLEIDGDTCGNQVMTAGSEAFVVADSDNNVMRYIDSHDGGNFHVHSTFDLSQGSEVYSASLLHASGVETDDDHDH